MCIRDSIEGEEKPYQLYLAQEMLKAPPYISSHGRFNEVGSSCYYFADKKEGAINEIKKHCGSKTDVYKRQGFAQHISAVVLDKTDIIVLTVFSTLENVSIYGVYNLSLIHI